MQDGYYFGEENKVKCPECGHVQGTADEEISGDPHDGDEFTVTCNECGLEIDGCFNLHYYIDQSSDSYARQFFKLRGFEEIPGVDSFAFVGWALETMMRHQDAVMSDYVKPGEKYYDEQKTAWEFVAAHKDDPVVQEKSS